ncbi:hypothetical protein HF984_10310 [Rothia terrae]|uniref:cation:proton antiporter domain-containing protein n=1 Tax=Rothia terrae TaxID=396015 RepID=UPI0014451844|nr:hypothetical protein [Rothia terrae]
MVEILIVIGAAIIIGNTIAEKFKLIAPLVLIAVGALVSFIPHLPPIAVDPHLVLSVFLPLLLYWEALNISLRGIKRTFRGIMLNGTLMVIFVAVSVGLVGHLVGLTLGAALLIGAAVGPTDATAVAALGKGISPRQMIVLRAESLINDGTALVVFALALEYATDEVKITATHAIGSFLLSFVGGAVVGLAVGWVIARIGRFVESHMIASAFRMVTSFIAFFLAEEIEASGVLAVVVTGLYMAQVGPKFVSMQSRVLARQVWGVASYILNSLLFLLVGLYLPATVRGLNSDSLTHALLATVAIYCAMMLARWIFGETIIRLIRMLDRRPSQKLRRTTVFERLVSTVAGFRGAISLAVAFSIPETPRKRRTLPIPRPDYLRDLRRRHSLASSARATTTQGCRTHPKEPQPARSTAFSSGRRRIQGSSTYHRRTRAGRFAAARRRTRRTARPSRPRPRRMGTQAHHRNKLAGRQRRKRASS